jgi:hypothetical protein
VTEDIPLGVKAGDSNIAPVPQRGSNTRNTIKETHSRICDYM